MFSAGSDDVTPISKNRDLCVPIGRDAPGQGRTEGPHRREIIVDSPDRRRPKECEGKEGSQTGRQRPSVFPLAKGTTVPGRTVLVLGRAGSWNRSERRVALPVAGRGTPPGARQRSGRRRTGTPTFVRVGHRTQKGRPQMGTRRRFLSFFRHVTYRGGSSARRTATTGRRRPAVVSG